MCSQLDIRFTENKLIERTVFDTIALSNSAAPDSGEKKTEFSTDITVSLTIQTKHANKLCLNTVISDFSFVKRSKPINTFDDRFVILQCISNHDIPSRLLDVFGTLQASDTDCECGFSLMNAIKTKSQNCLEANHMDKRRRIKSYVASGCIVNLDSL